MAFSIQAASQADTTYTMTVKLVKVEYPPAHCGIFAWALTQKFQIIKSDFSLMKPGYPVLLNQPCPEFLGEGFFLKDQTYKVVVATTNNAPFGYTVVNNTKSNLPILWVRTIEVLNQQIN